MADGFQPMFFVILAAMFLPFLMALAGTAIWAVVSFVLCGLTLLLSFGAGPIAVVAWIAALICAAVGISSKRRSAQLSQFLRAHSRAVDDAALRRNIRR